VPSGKALAWAAAGTEVDISMMLCLFVCKEFPYEPVCRVRGDDRLPPSIGKVEEGEGEKEKVDEGRKRQQRPP
jgi:hypothetical protein